jgi:uncharacterized membrane protein YfcA
LDATGQRAGGGAGRLDEVGRLSGHSAPGRDVEGDEATGLERDELVQAQGISFTTSTLSLSLVLLASGTLNAGIAQASLLAVLVTFVGMFIGQYIRKFVQPEVFRFLFFVLMLGLGIHLAFIR